MRDLVTRLEDHPPGDKLYHEAAAEIKALRSRLHEEELKVRDVCEQRDAVSHERNELRSRLEACEAALRSFDVGRESSYWADGVERQSSNAGAECADAISRVIAIEQATRPRKE